jgi:predicted RNase H-like HicB family nuclease
MEKNKIDRYKIILWWSDEDEAFLAAMPDLPGCMADGATQEEALANIREVAGLWVKRAKELGRAIPEPTTTTGQVAA